MAGDDKITLQVGSINRTTPVRSAVSRADTPATATPRAVDTAPAPLPVARLINLARELSEAPPPIDHARISALRNAIANGAYAVDAALVAKAVTRFYQGGSQDGSA